MNAAELLSECSARGLRLRVDGEHLIVSGKREAISASLAAALRSNKPALIALLEAQAHRIISRSRVVWNYCCENETAAGTLICELADARNVQLYLERLHGAKVIALSRAGSVH